MTSFRLRRRPVAVTAAGAALALAAASLGMPTASARDREDDRPDLLRRDRGQTVQLVEVQARTPAERARVAGLGLDVTEAADADSIDVVLHGQQDADALRRAGLMWKVTVRDLDALRRANAAKDRAYAASVTTSPLPSGRDHYRTLPDYNREMRALARRHPRLVRLIRLRHRSVQGRVVLGVEVTRNVRRTADGKPVLLMLGAHHAREWPSSEHTMEFAYDLVRSYRRSARATRIVNQGRTILVPVVNVDGFQVSRAAPPQGDLSVDDYEMKRKNCRASTSTPAQFTTGTCADNPAGRLRGTDLNRNYPGFWGGPGASASWSDDTYRGDSPASEPEVRNIRSLISHRQVTGLITNHTYGNMVLRPPSTYDTGVSLEDDTYEALGAAMTRANGYSNWAAYQLYDTSGSTEDWSYWNTGGFGFTFEIGTQGFHPVFRDAVVGEYVGQAPAAGAGTGGNREAYFRFAAANLRRAHHATIVGRAPRNRVLSVRKTFTSLTSPVITDDAAPDVTTAPRRYRDVLSSRLRPRGGVFRWAVNPSTRPAVAGRGGRQPQGPAQPAVDLTNPAGVPAVGSSERATFEVSDSAAYDNARALVTVSWPGTAGDEALDWDVVVYDAAGEIVTSAASLAEPEIAPLVDPAPGVYTVEVTNYAGGTEVTDWTGRVTFEQPRAPVVTGVKEAWTLRCATSSGRVLSARRVVVDRGETIDVGRVCRAGSR